MKQEVLIGQTDYTVLVKIRDTAGAPATGLTQASIDIAYARVETDNDVTTADVTPVALATPALTDPHLDWGFLEVSATDHPGLYRLDIADAVFATGAWSAVVTVVGTGLDPADMEFVLVTYDSSKVGSDLQLVYSDTTAIHTQTTTVASDLVIVASDLLQVYSDTTHIDSDVVVIGGQATTIASDLVIVASDLLQVYSDTTAVHSDTTAVHSDTTAIHTTTGLTSTTAIAIYSDTTAMHTQTTTIASDLVIVASDLLQVYSDTTIITSDTTAIHTQTTTIASDLVIVASDLLQVYSDTTIVASDLVIAASDVALLEGSTTQPAQGAPSATASPLTQINYLYKAWRNKKTQTASDFILFADDASTADHKATVSDDGTTFTIGEMATGA